MEQGSSFLSGHLRLITITIDGGCKYYECRALDNQLDGSEFNKDAVKVVERFKAIKPKQKVLKVEYSAMAKSEISKKHCVEIASDAQ